MLRLASRSSATPPSPQRLRQLVLEHRPSPAQAGREWSPGDPIRFAHGSAEMERSPSGGKQAGEPGDEMGGASGTGEWQPGDAIRFGGEEREVEHDTRRQSRAQATRETGLFRPSVATVATRGSSCATPSPSSSKDSWPLSHRWDPPSPSLSSASSALSSGSTARFSVSHAYATSVLPVTPGRAPPLSQKELDELVSGIDFEDTSELLDDIELESEQVKPLSQTSKLRQQQQPTSLAPEELHDLLEGIDFSEVALSDEELDGASFDSDVVFFTAPTSARPASPAPEPATPPRPSPFSPRIIRRSPPSTSAAIPAAPKEPDVFSPAPPSRLAPPSTFAPSPLRPTPSVSREPSPRPSPTLSPFSSRRAPSPAVFLPSSAASAAPQPRAYSTAPPKPDREGKGKAKVVIDLCDSPSSSPAPPAASSRADGSDDEVVFLPSKKAAAAKTKPSMSAGPGKGWFQRPAGLAPQAQSGTTVPPSSFHSSSAAPSASAAEPSSSSAAPAKKPHPASIYTRKTTSYVSAVTGKKLIGRAGRAGAKAAQEEEKQRKLREKWPRVFSYKSWEGRKEQVRVVCSTDEGEIARELRAMKGPVGFDLEWNPYYRIKGSSETKQGKTALVQVCDERTVLLVQVSKMPRFPPALKEFIEDRRQVKLGVQIAGDASKLTRDFGHKPSGTLELNALVRQYDPQRFENRQKPGLIGLQELTGIYLDRYLPKDSNVHAANDVYASLQILLAIQSLTDKQILPEDLVRLAATPYNSWHGFSVPARSPLSSTSSGAIYNLPPLPSSAAAVTDAPPPSTALDPSSVLPPRKLEAFVLFRDERLSLTEMAERMSRSLPIKASSVLWNLLDCHQKLKLKGVEVEWDAKRFVAAFDEVKLHPKMVEEHGATMDALRAQAAQDEA
ncbi:hypothetical protein JCM10213_004921 [Rhodosporidiobolus nylandii]